MTRRQRIDSFDKAGEVVAAAFRGIVPPAHISLTEADMPFWSSVVNEFASSEWTQHQLEVAAQLAKAMADLETERSALRVEGYVLALGDKSYANPRHGVARDLTNSVMSLRRNLSLHARAQGGEARDVGRRREIAKGIETGADTGDDLIASPASIN